MLHVLYMHIQILNIHTYIHTYRVITSSLYRPQRSPKPCLYINYREDRLRTHSLKARPMPSRYSYIHATYIHTYMHACIYTCINYREDRLRTRSLKARPMTSRYTYIHATYIHTCMHVYIHASIIAKTDSEPVH